jgi:hypothetical protein
MEGLSCLLMSIIDYHISILTEGDDMIFWWYILSVAHLALMTTCRWSTYTRHDNTCSSFMVLAKTHGKILHSFPVRFVKTHRKVKNWGTQTNQKAVTSPVKAGSATGKVIYVCNLKLLPCCSLPIYVCRLTDLQRPCVKFYRDSQV